MALEFSKIVDQVQKMGAMIEQLDFDLNERLLLARERFFAATDLDAIHARIEMARQPDVSGYRGAAPPDSPYHEIICRTFPPLPAPPSATLLAKSVRCLLKVAPRNV